MVLISVCFVHACRCMRLISSLPLGCCLLACAELPAVSSVDVYVLAFCADMGNMKPEN